MRNFVALSLILLSVPIAASPAAPAARPPGGGEAPHVEELVAIALERSPALGARRSALDAARQMERPAGALADPMVEAMLQNADFPDVTVGEMEMSMVGVEVRQGLPYPGKRRARVAAARAASAVRAAELAAAESRVATEVRTLYARLYAVDRERRSLAAAGQLIDLLSTTAAARYSTGAGEQEPILKAQLELNRLGEVSDDLDFERAGLVAELNRWLDRPGDAPLGEVARLPAVAPAGGDPAPAGADAAPAALELSPEISSPEVELARAGVTAAERRLETARLDLKPDFAPAVSFASRGSLGPVVGLRFGVELPFWKSSKQEPMIRAAEQEVEAARGELRDALAMARAEAARQAVRWRQADRQIVRFQQAILPQSSAALDAARASYLAGRGDFSTVVEDFKLWLEARVQLSRREADRFGAWAELARLTGAPLSPQPAPALQTAVKED